MIKYKKSHIRIIIKIKPSYISNIKKFVEKELNEEILKYSKKNEGFLIFFKFIKRGRCIEIKEDGDLKIECFLKTIHLCIEKNSILKIKDGYFLQTFQTNLIGDGEIEFKDIIFNQKGEEILNGHVLEK